MKLTLRRSARSVLHTLGIGLTAMGIAALWCAPARADVVTAGSLLTATKAAIAKQPGVRVVFSVESSSSSSTEKIVADVGVTGGTEAVSRGTAHLAVKVLPTYGYVSGNSAGLTAIFGLSSANAKRVGADWVSWKAGTSQYTNLKSGLTMPAVVALLPKAKGTKLTTQVKSGVTVYVLKWTTAATSSAPQLANVLSISSGASPLPIQQTVTASDGTKATTTLSLWGEQVLVNAPAPASTIAASKAIH